LHCNTDDRQQNEETAMTVEALVFDAYGTLFDVHSVSGLCDRLWPGAGRTLSQVWRTKQLEYTWQRSLAGRYASFEQVTVDALRYACELLNLECGSNQVRALMREYWNLSAFPGTAENLSALSNFKLAILSNGTPDMLAAAVAHNGMQAHFAAVLSVHRLQVFKPHPSVYQLAVDELGVAPERIGFVSSNCWDACGAKSFGFRSFWINRAGAPVDRLGYPPDAVVRELDEVRQALQA
jgi:2-haloacid dehalogenase